MILSNTAIHEALDHGRLVITPEPRPRAISVDNPQSPYQTTAVDLTLGPVLQVPKEEPLAVSIDFREAERVADTLSALTSRVEIDAAQGYKLEPGILVLGRTLETIRLPLPDEYAETAPGKPCLSARVEGKSSRARFGVLIHFTAPTIHAGFEGPITLEVMNLGKQPVVLYRNMPICQLIFEEVQGLPSPNESQFQGQTTPAGN